MSYENQKQKESFKFSQDMNLVPDVYVPAWKSNVKHQKHFNELCELSNTCDSTHCDTLFLNKRERLEKEEISTELPSRKLNHTNNSHLSKYNAFLRYRK